MQLQICTTEQSLRRLKLRRVSDRHAQATVSNRNGSYDGPGAESWMILRADGGDWIARRMLRIRNGLPETMPIPERTDIENASLPLLAFDIINWYYEGDRRFPPLRIVARSPAE